jgi:nitrogen PTS system EIIA component
VPEHEIMTVEEVARYLRVSERTVYEWAQRGDIPAGKLGTTWRFKRKAIQGWVDQQLTTQKGRKPVSAPGAVSLSEVLSSERVKLLEADSKREALLEVVDLLASAPQVADRRALEQHIFQREELMSTGIGLGIAVPHVRLPSVTDTVMAVGVAPTPIADYQSLDGKGVSIICMVASSEGQHARYIRTLAAISSRLRDDTVRESVMSADEASTIYNLLVG